MRLNNGRSNIKRLITFTLLGCVHQFVGSLHAVVSKSHIRALYFDLISNIIG